MQVAERGWVKAQCVDDAHTDLSFEHLDLLIYVICVDMTQA